MAAQDVKLDIQEAIKTANVTMGEANTAIRTAQNAKTHLQSGEFIRQLVEHIAGPLPAVVKSIDLLTHDGRYWLVFFLESDRQRGANVMATWFRSSGFLYPDGHKTHLYRVMPNLATYAEQLVKHENHPDLVAWLYATRATFCNSEIK